METMSGQYASVVQGHLTETPTRTSPSGQSGSKATRNRQPVSCQACRRSKLKCNRERPCEACIRRGYRDQCFYEAAKVVPRKKRRTAGNHSAQERLRNLEALVLQFANGQAMGSPKATPASSVDSAGQSGAHHTPNEGHVVVRGSASTYVGSTHWSAILDNIQELKNVVNSEDISEDGHPDQLDLFDPDTLFLFSAPRPSSLEKILEALPPKTLVDRYMSVYFKAAYLVLPILHQGRFQQQYQDFWTDPLRAPPLWTSILFSILVTASTVNIMNQASSNTEEEHARREEFLGAAAQCLIIGNYGRPQDSRPFTRSGLILAIVFRFAFELGLHREPDHFSHMSVFEGEMRRRVWAICRQIDLLQGFQLGLPTYIPDDSFDTRLFSNLSDTDFDENSTFLPESRPETEPTRILQFKEKCRIINAFGRAYRTAISLKPISVDTVMELNEEVREAHAKVPPSLRIRSIASSFADSSSVIMARVDIELLFRKTLCTLHRKAMIAGNAYSRAVCRESAMSILTHLIDLRKELQSGHSLAGDQWLMSCYTMHDFLLAAMLLCLLVSQKRKGDAKAYRESQEEIPMIKEAYLATSGLSHQSKEAKRVSLVLASMLSSLESNFSDMEMQPQQHVSQRPTDQDVAAAVAFPTASITSPEPPHYTFEHDPFENLNSIQEDIDWACLDQYYLNTNPNMFMYNTAEAASAQAMPEGNTTLARDSHKPPKRHSHTIPPHSQQSTI